MASSTQNEVPAIDPIPSPIAFPLQNVDSTTIPVLP